MAAAANKRAEELMAKGDKCLTRYSFFGSSSGKFEDAAECYADAGKQFVMGKAPRPRLPRRASRSACDACNFEPRGSTYDA